MKVLTSVSLLLLVSVVQPAPRHPTVFQERHPEIYGPYIPERDTWHPSSWEEDEELVLPQEQQQDEATVVREDDYESSGEDVDGPLWDLERDLEDDLNRTAHALLLIHILLEGKDRTAFFAPRPTYIDRWGFSDFSPSDSGVPQYDDDGMFGFPDFGIDQPTYSSHDFPSFPVFPDFPSVDDLPDNYDNSTHEVHVVNGTRIEVNKTISKESDDGFHSFFHHEVIHIRPEQDTVNEDPTDQDSDTTTPQWEEEDISGGEIDLEGNGTEAPPEEEALPSVPEVENEVASSAGLPTSNPNVVPAEQVFAGEVSNI